MGCQQSKETVVGVVPPATTAAAATNRPNSSSSSNNNNNNNNNNYPINNNNCNYGQGGGDDATTNHSSNTLKNKKKQKSTTATSTSSSSTSTTAKKTAASTSSSPHPGALYFHLLGGIHPYSQDKNNSSINNNNNKTASTTTNNITTNNHTIILKAQSTSFWEEARQLCILHPTLASYVDPTTLGTPLHVACSLGAMHVRVVDAAATATTTPYSYSSSAVAASSSSSKMVLCQTALQAVSLIISSYPLAIYLKDKNGHVPLEGIMAAMVHEKKKNKMMQHSNPTTTTTTTRMMMKTPNGGGVEDEQQQLSTIMDSTFLFRYQCTKLLLQQNPPSSSKDDAAAAATTRSSDALYPSGGLILHGTRKSTQSSSALYSIIESFMDDKATPLGPTVEYMKLLVEYGGATVQPVVGYDGGGGDGVDAFSTKEEEEEEEEDTVLALLYRRFVRQFDESERFFTGDNSRPEVLQHRQQYKNAAVNTFNIIELVLRLPKKKKNKNNRSNTNEEEEEGDEQDYLVHNAVRSGSCPPDLLRYIVETNLDSVAIPDARGNLPLHYAAAAAEGYYVKDDGGDIKGGGGGGGGGGIPKKPLFTSPESYSKYVIDELLYAYPEGASIPDANGVLPIVLAIESGKKWIGGGIRSLHEAYPSGIQHANLGNDHPLLYAMSFTSQEADQGLGTTSTSSYTTSPRIDRIGGGGGEEEEEEDDQGTIASGVDGGGGRRRKRQQRRKINKDESHDAIMFVQRPDVAVRDIVSVMWANEEDGGVQMLGCSALEEAVMRVVATATTQAKTHEVVGIVDAIASVALLGVPTVVNAMKNHPNEPAVQEKACSALSALTPADGVREISFAASGAISTVVSAMQAHVSDGTVQKEACTALRKIATTTMNSPERATVVASVSGFTALVNSLAAHPYNRDVQREACAALDVLTSYHDACLPELHEQTETLLRAAATNFPEDCSESANAILSRIK